MSSLQSEKSRRISSDHGPPRVDPRSIYLHAPIFGLASVLWILSLRRINLSALSDVGLISVLPATFFIAIGLLAVGFSWAFTSHVPRWMLETYVLVLIVFLHAIAPILYTVPKYSYVYKHIAVIEFIEQAGAAYRNIDIYQNWPGFFSANAILSKVVGVDAIDYANIALPLFMLCNILAVRFVARAITDDPRRVAVTLWIFVLGSWLAPTYLAPQSMAYVMALTILGVVIKYLPPISGSRERMLSWLRVSSSPTDQEGSAVIQDGFSRPVAIVLVLTLSAAVVVSHQLTPFFLVVSLVILRLTKRGGSWSLPLAITIMTIAQIALSYRYLSGHQTLASFDLFSNVQGAQRKYPTAGSAGHQLVAHVARGLSVLLLAFGLLGWWRVGRRGGETWVLLLALAPGLLVFVQAYGGEAIYRVYAFMCCWLSFLAAGWFAQIAPRNGWQRYALSVGSSVVIVALIISYFGLERSDHIQPQEVAAAKWFERSTPHGSIITFLSGNYPSPATARYSEHFTGDGSWGGEVMGDERFAGRELTESDIPAVAKSLIDLAGPNQSVYLALGPSQEAFASSYGYAPEHALEQFGDILVKDRRFRVVFQEKNAYILEVLSSNRS